MLLGLLFCTRLVEEAAFLDEALALGGTVSLYIRRRYQPLCRRATGGGAGEYCAVLLRTRTADAPTQRTIYAGLLIDQ